jgi:hypothetical protein
MRKEWIAIIFVLAASISFSAYHFGKMKAPYQASSKGNLSATSLVGSWVEADNTSVYEFKSDGSVYIGSLPSNVKVRAGSYSHKDATHIRIVNAKGVTQELRFEIDRSGSRAIVQYPMARERFFKRLDYNALTNN